MPISIQSNDLPDALLGFLVQTFGTRRHLTAIETTSDQKVVRWYGETDHFALNPKAGICISDILPVMLGFEDQTHVELPNVSVADGQPFDLYVFPTRSDQRRMIVLLDASGAVANQQEMQQKANEIALLNYRQKQLMQELELARGQAEQASDLKSQFIAGMSHEFRTPLTAILGLCEIIRRHPGEAAKRIDAVTRSANHLLALVENLLEHGRVEVQEIRIDPLPVNLESTISGLNSMFDPLARQKSLGLRFEAHGELPETVITDPVRLRQILVNLIANALRYTVVGEVTVQWWHHDNQLRVEISDTGPGIPADSRQLIFQPFAQLDSDRGKGGIGLGLSICQKMAEALYGSLTLDSVPGQGSTFTLSIPCVEAGSSAAAVQIQDGALVLVVDDDLDIQELLSVVLSDMSFAVVTAFTAEHALQLAASESPQLVLADLNLGDDDGLQLIQTLTEKFSNMRVIAMSATTDEHSRRVARGAGAAAFLIKPFDFSELEYELRNQPVTDDAS